MSCPDFFPPGSLRGVRQRARGNPREAGFEIGGPDGLGDEIVHSGGEAAADVLGESVGGQRDDPDIAPFRLRQGADRGGRRRARPSPASARPSARGGRRPAAAPRPRRGRHRRRRPGSRSFSNSLVTTTWLTLLSSATSTRSPGAGRCRGAPLRLEVSPARPHSDRARRGSPTGGAGLISTAANPASTRRMPQLGGGRQRRQHQPNAGQLRLGERSSAPAPAGRDPACHGRGSPRHSAPGRRRLAQQRHDAVRFVDRVERCAPGGQLLGHDLLADRVVGDKHDAPAVEPRRRAPGAPGFRRRQGGGEPELAALPLLAGDADRAAHQRRQLARNRQAEAAAAIAPRHGRVGLGELLEQARQYRGGDADPGIGHVEAQQKPLAAPPAGSSRRASRPAPPISRRPLSR